MQTELFGEHFRKGALTRLRVRQAELANDKSIQNVAILHDFTQIRSCANKTQDPKNYLVTWVPERVVTLWLYNSTNERVFVQNVPLAIVWEVLDVVLMTMFSELVTFNRKPCKMTYPDKHDLIRWIYTSISSNESHFRMWCTTSGIKNMWPRFTQFYINDEFDFPVNCSQEMQALFDCVCRRLCILFRN